MQALLAGPLYGVGVQPLSTVALRRLRAASARLMGLGTPGGSPELVWALERPGLDPLAQHWGAILLRYSRE